MKKQRILLLIAFLFIGVTIFPQLSLKIVDKKETYQPLDTLVIFSETKGQIEVYDARGDRYFSSEIEEKVKMVVGGTLGSHDILLKSKKGVLLDMITFTVDCKTEINDASGKYRELLDVLYHSMTGEWKRESDVRRFNGQYYHTFVGWLRDHVHTLKGMKYFYPEVKSGIDLYGDSQREDGMIWDNYDQAPGSYWIQRFRYGDFVKYFEGNDMIFTRIPVENDVEYLFIEGIYYTWKATGDTEWMKGMIDKALKALEYSTTSPYRWSDKYQLLKRGYTIDTWDFQNDEDAAISVGEGNMPDAMIVTAEHTRFGIMFGDNTGMIAACRYLSEMLNVAGRKEEAEKIQQLSNDLEVRLNELSWNGEFFTHHVPEDTSIKRDLGVDEKTQVSLSNAYSLNRGISHDKAVNIIKTYQQIRTEMPATSPGEFYTIYPPFENGYGGHNSKWNYMNGGVTSIVAGELAHGAFEHGFEQYGVDILDRQLALAKKTDNYLHCTYRGQMPEEPERTFTPISLKEVANTDFAGNTQKGVMGWTNEGENDLHEFPTGKQIFKGIEFTIIDPEENGRKACLGLSEDSAYTQQARINVDKKAKSIYFLHTANKTTFCGSITIRYADGSSTLDYITPGKITSWWYPAAPQNRKQMPNLQVAWTGKNKFSDKVGVGVYGLNNPKPDKVISEIVFDAAKDGTKWMVLGLSLSDTNVLFTPDIISGGIPDNWGAAAVVYALVEGLAGVKDQGQTFNNVLLTPRWEAANEKEVSVTIKYEASKAYISYKYLKTKNEIYLTFTGTQDETDLQVLLPEGRQVIASFVNDKAVDTGIKKVESSNYAFMKISGKGVYKVKFILE